MRRTEKLVEGKTVRLVADKELVDRYDRLLRFIYVGDVLVNRVLVEQGYAEVVLYPPNDAHYDEFVHAGSRGSGGWTGLPPDRHLRRWLDHALSIDASELQFSAHLC